MQDVLCEKLAITEIFVGNDAFFDPFPIVVASAVKVKGASQICATDEAKSPLVCLGKSVKGEVFIQFVHAGIHFLAVVLAIYFPLRLIVGGWLNLRNPSSSRARLLTSTLSKGLNRLTQQHWVHFHGMFGRKKCSQYERAPWLYSG